MQREASPEAGASGGALELHGRVPCCTALQLLTGVAVCRPRHAGCAGRHAAGHACTLPYASRYLTPRVPASCAPLALHLRLGCLGPTGLGPAHTAGPGQGLCNRIVVKCSVTSERSNVAIWTFVRNQKLV
jgi:hypothetical protein